MMKMMKWIFLVLIVNTKIFANDTLSFVLENSIEGCSSSHDSVLSIVQAQSDDLISIHVIKYKDLYNSTFYFNRTFSFLRFSYNEDKCFYQSTIDANGNLIAYDLNKWVDISYGERKFNQEFIDLHFTRMRTVRGKKNGEDVYITEFSDNNFLFHVYMTYSSKIGVSSLRINYTSTTDLRGTCMIGTVIDLNWILR